MSAVFVAELNAGAICPEVALSIGFAGAQLEANLTAALAIQASVSLTPPTLAVQLAATLKAVAALQAGIALGLPGVSFSASVAAALVAKAQLEIGNLSILLALLGGPAAFVYSYSGGTLSTIGSDLAAAISGTPPPGLAPTDPVSGILVGASPGAWAGISPFFGGL